MTKRDEMIHEALEAIKEALQDGYSSHYSDLHNEVFNTDYYIIGTHQAKEALKAYDVFDALEEVQTYERDNFGEIYTDLSDPEKLVNMVYYIIGEEVLSELQSFNDYYDCIADDELNAIIVREIDGRL